MLSEVAVVPAPGQLLDNLNYFNLRLTADRRLRDGAKYTVVSAPIWKPLAMLVKMYILRGGWLVLASKLVDAAGRYV